MPNRTSFRDTLLRYDRHFFRATGFTLISLLKFGAIAVMAIVGIGLTILYTNSDQSSVASGTEGVGSKRLTSQEKFVVVSEFPSDYAGKLPVEKISILKSKIEVGEALAMSGGRYAERATDQLVSIYGELCQLQDLERIDSQKAYGRLSELRQQALAARNVERVAAADFLRAFSATRRLSQYSERADFRFTTDAVLNLNSKELVNVERIKELYDYAIELHDTSSKQDSTALFLSVLADKLNGSPSSEISNLGLSLKDHAKYARYYAAVGELPYTTRESKLEFFDEMFSEIEKAPPQSPETYQVVFRLIDRLTNVSDADFAGTLTKRLGKAASMVSPRIKADVDQSIQNMETRIATLGETMDLSGASSSGTALKLPNGKPTTLVFWTSDNLKSIEHVESLANSERFDSLETNVLVAGMSSLSEEQLSKAQERWSKFTILDNATSSRLGVDIGVDFTPYQVSFDKDGKVVRLGEPAN